MDFEGPLGECPDITMPRAVSHIDWYQREVAELTEANAALTVENRGLRGDLETARGELATAKALGSRSGW